MLRKLAILLLPLALLVAACSPGGDSAKREAPAEPPASLSDGEIEGADTVTDQTDGESDSSLLSTFSPFELLESVGEQSSSGEVDPILKAVLLEAGDLPAGFLSFGEFSMSAPTEYGPVDMATSMFLRGDLTSDEMGEIVMSIAALLPPEALDELGDPSNLAAQSEAELEAFKSELGELGSLDLLDASGLGDGGLGLRMELDFGGLFGALGASEEDTSDVPGIVMEMYMFVRGEHLLMVLVMAPSDLSPGIDARGLAETMDERAADAF